MPRDEVFAVVFTSRGNCVGKMRKAVTNTAHAPIVVASVILQPGIHGGVVTPTKTGPWRWRQR